MSDADRDALVRELREGHSQSVTCSRECGSCRDDWPCAAIRAADAIAAQPTKSRRDEDARIFISGFLLGAEYPSDAGDGDAMGNHFRAWRTSDDAELTIAAQPTCTCEEIEKACRKMAEQAALGRFPRGDLALRTLADGIHAHCAKEHKR